MPLFCFVLPPVERGLGYDLVLYRLVSPDLFRLLIEDLVRKTTVPFEILVWLNIDDPEYEAFLQGQRAQGIPLCIVGKTPENIGMYAYRPLFEQARHELIVQIDDDVVAVSRNIAEQAHEIFVTFQT